MSCTCRTSKAAAQAGANADRYVSFQGIDCEGNTRAVMALIDRYTLGGEQPPDRFWRYFHQRRAATLGPRFDDLLLLSSFVNPVRELFEAHGDAQGLALLEKLEDECF